MNSGIPKTYTNQQSWTLDDGTVVLDLAKGRLDFTYGMDKGAFADPKYIKDSNLYILVLNINI